MVGDGAWPERLIILFVTFTVVVSKEIQVQPGEDIHFDLPGYIDCGQFSLLDPQLKPVVIVQGRAFHSIIGPYKARSVIERTDTGYNLTIGQTSAWDSGDYTLAVSSRDAQYCEGIRFTVVIQAGSTPADKTLGAWGTWSTCKKSCDPSSSQFRSRDCLTSGTCAVTEATNETRTCDQAEHCPRWTEWGNWSNCSAKCGKGFKIRKRACVNGESALLKSTDCSGAPTQSILCMTVCEVVGYWDPWADWGNCSRECGGGTRNRTRMCVSDSRVTKNSCDGDNEQSQACNQHPCPNTIVTAAETEVPSTMPSTESTVLVKDEDEPLNIAVVVVVSCIAGIVLVVILVLICRRRCAYNKAVDAVRRPDRGRRKPKTSTASTGEVAQKEKSGTSNVYSELSSSFVYPTSEFESVFFEDDSNGAKTVHIPQLENIEEARGDEEEADLDIDYGDFDYQFNNAYEQDNPSANCDEDNAKNDIVEEKEGMDIVYNEPPEEGPSENAKRKIGMLDIPTITLDLDDMSEAGSVYYEPPETPNTFSKKISTISNVSVPYAQISNRDRANDRKVSTASTESVYENISDVQRDTIDELEEKYSPNFDTDYSRNEKDVHNQNSDMSEIARQKEWEAFNNEHIYVNYPKDLEIENCEQEKYSEPEDIYDTPKFKD